MCENNWMKEIWRHIIAFGAKPMGSENLRRTAVYLEGIMRDVCGNAKLCRYPEQAWEGKEWALLDGEGKEIESYLFLESGGSEWFEGRVEFAGYHRVWDMYVWKRYMIVSADREIKAYLTVREGEEAIPQMLFARSDLPHFMVGSRAEKLLEAAQKDRTLFRGYARIEKKRDSWCRNILGSIGEGAEKVVLCAHYDTVYSTAGAYDNAAGTAVVLETARRLRTYQVKNRIEVLLTDGEEFNLRGARNQAEAENEKPAFVLNIDGVGRENILEVWSGPETFERKIRNILDESREVFIPKYICPPPPGSDHAPYYEKGSDVCMLTFNDQGILHSPKDVYEDSKLANMEKMVRIILELLEGLGVIEK